MSNSFKIQQSILTSHVPLSLSELLLLNPSISSRTVQRSLSELISNGSIIAGAGRSRKSVATSSQQDSIGTAQDNNFDELIADEFPTYVPLSADSKDILNYIKQPLEARTPVGYQRSLIDDYQPNVSFYLSAQYADYCLAHCFTLMKMINR